MAFLFFSHGPSTVAIAASIIEALVADLQRRAQAELAGQEQQQQQKQFLWHNSQQALKVALALKRTDLLFSLVPAPRHSSPNPFSLPLHSSAA